MAPKNLFSIMIPVLPGPDHNHRDDMGGILLFVKKIISCHEKNRGAVMPVLNILNMKGENDNVLLKKGNMLADKRSGNK